MLRFALLAFLIVTSAACEEDRAPALPSWSNAVNPPPTFDCADARDTDICEGTWSAHCDGSGKAQRAVNCERDELTCVAGLGCRTCVPDGTGCSENNEVYRCASDGDSYEVTEDCELGTVCNAAAQRCIDLCAAAEAGRSYIGCDYWAVTTSNSQLDADRTALGNFVPRVFDFELAIANPEAIEALVTVHRGTREVKRLNVAPKAVQRVVLPWVEDLVGRGDPHTSQVFDGAYHVKSTVPVTIHQHNPMDFSRDVTDGRAFSFTNDASLLLPTHVLTGNYMVMSRASLAFQVTSEVGTDSFSIPGFVAIVGADDADVTVEITSTAFTQASPDDSVPAMQPGETVSLLLGPGDVIQLTTQQPAQCTPDPKADPTAGGNTLTHCVPDPDYDLTGTTIRASGKVFVVGGHDCARVPFNMVACDHLEETMFPEEAWGTRVPIAVSATIEGERELPDVVRVVSSHDDNHVTFQPAVHDAVTLQRGEHMEFVATRDFVVTGSEALMVAQFLVGQNYNDLNATTGDPAMSLGIPDEQWRNSYAFIAPDSYLDNFVNVIAPAGAPIKIDGDVIENWRPIEGTTLATARVSVRSGQHHMTGPALFGITVYGYAPYTSYMVPGGLDLLNINGPD